MDLFKVFILTPIIAVFTFMPAITDAGEDKRGDIILEISGLKDTSGQIGVLLFDSKKGFPAKDRHSVVRLLERFSSLSPTIQLKDIPYGKYALTVMHDENSNSRLDTNWFGIPEEGVGVSNYPQGMAGPPSYDNAQFEITRSSITLIIKVFYLE